MRMGAAVGRRLFNGRDPDSVIAQCKQVWALGGTDVEAAAMAQISTVSLCRFLKSNPDIAALRNNLRCKPILFARMTIVRSLDDPKLAWKYLEHKLPEEFAVKKRL